MVVTPLVKRAEVIGMEGFEAPASPYPEPLAELARIFAAAILRLRARHALENSPESAAVSLELSPETPLTVHAG
jgi:hypothetical protein